MVGVLDGVVGVLEGVVGVLDGDVDDGELLGDGLGDPWWPDG